MTIWTEVRPGFFVSASGKERKLTMPDGEYRLCRSCERRGYGVDAWWPMTSEHWPMMNGSLWFGRCRACNADIKAGKRGVMPDDMGMAA
jgi:hypothetical protein